MEIQSVVAIPLPDGKERIVVIMDDDSKVIFKECTEKKFVALAIQREYPSKKLKITARATLHEKVEETNAIKTAGFKDNSLEIFPVRRCSHTTSICKSR